MNTLLKVVGAMFVGLMAVGQLKQMNRNENKSDESQNFKKDNTQKNTKNVEGIIVDAKACKVVGVLDPNNNTISGSNLSIVSGKDNSIIQSGCYIKTDSKGNVWLNGVKTVYSVK